MDFNFIVPESFSGEVELSHGTDYKDVIFAPYIPAPVTKTIGNFDGMIPGTDDTISRLNVLRLKETAQDLISELTDKDKDPDLLNLMDIGDVKDMEEVLYGIVSKIVEFKRKARLQIKAKLLLEEEIKDLDLSEEELIGILELAPEVDQKKLTIDKIIRYYPSLILNNIDRFKEYKNAKKEKSRGSDSSTESES